MEHEPSEFKSTENPFGVGPCFGITQGDGLDHSNQLDVIWCDKKQMDIAQILAWLCPPVNKDKPVRVRDPDSGKMVLLYICGYTLRGVKVLVQNPDPSAAKAVRKRKSPAPKSPPATKAAPKPARKRKSPAPKSPPAAKAAAKAARKRKTPAPKSPPAAKAAAKPARKRKTPAPKSPPAAKAAAKSARKKKTPAPKSPPAAKAVVKPPRKRKTPAPKSTPAAKAAAKSARKKIVASRTNLLQSDDDELTQDEELSDPWSDDEEPPADMHWKRFRRDPLKPEQRRLLDEQVVVREQEIIDVNFNKNQ